MFLAWGFLFSEEIRDEKVANLGLRGQRCDISLGQRHV